MPDWDRLLPTGSHRWTVGIRSGSAEAFFAPSSEYDEVVAERRRWIAEDADAYVRMLPEAARAVDATLDLARRSGVPIAPTNDCDAAAALVHLASHCELDLVWLGVDEQATMRVVGGAVCFPSHWSLPEKIGLPLADVHAIVPALNVTLGGSIDALLRKLDGRTAWTRQNWGLAADAERNQHPSQRRPRLTADAGWDGTWLRIEHQLLVGLAVAEAVLFALRIEIVPLTALRADPAAAARLAMLLETMSPKAAEYKGLIESRPRLIELLRKP